MIRDCEDGRIDLIVTKSVSRFSRNVYDCIGYVRKLAALKHPVGVYFETEQIYTLKQDSEMGMDFIAILAQEESRAKSNSMNLSYEMRFRRGIVLTPELLGYDLNEDRELVINEDEALTVRLIFFLYLYGCTCQQIAETLMSLKRRTKRGSCKWSAGSVLNVLQNERHCGDVLARKTWTPNYLDHKSIKNIRNKNQYLYTDHHEAIILRDDFIAVQRLIANARYRYRGILPTLRVIWSGALKGFVSINPRWAGFRKEDYLRVAAGVAPKEKNGVSESYEARSGEFDLRGYEVARGEFFTSLQNIAVTFSANEIVFSTFSLGKLGYTPLIELLVDPIRRLFAVRPAAKECRNAVAWLRYDGKKYHVKRIVGTAFLPTFFQMSEWDVRCKYRVRGIYRQQDAGEVLLFDLRETEVTLPGKSRRDSTDTPYTVPEDMRPLTATAQKNILAYPVDWFDEFGTDYYRYAQMRELFSMMSGEDWELQTLGTPVSDVEGLAPTPEEELNRELNRMLGMMREEVNNVGKEP